MLLSCRKDYNHFSKMLKIFCRAFSTCIVLLSLVWFGLGPSCAEAAEWRLDGGANQVLGYDDNVSMQKNAEGSFEYMLTPMLNFVRKDRAWDVNASASYGLQEFTDIEGLDYSPQSYKAHGEYRTARTRWGIDVNYDDTLSRNNAVQDTGNFASTSNQIKWSVSPQFSYHLNRQDSLVVGASHSETIYSGSDFNSNEGQSGNIAWQRQWNERLHHSVSAFYNHYQFTGISDSTSDSYGINLMLAYRLSHKWSVQGTIGGRLTDVAGSSVRQQGVVGTQQSTGFLTDIGMDYKGEQVESSVRIGRSLMPSGQGNINEQTLLSLTASYKFSKRWQTNINASYQISDAVSQNQFTNNSFNNRNNLTLTPNINWAMTPEWVAQLSYRYRQQDSLFIAESNAVMLSITYNWLGFSLSR